MHTVTVILQKQMHNYMASYDSDHLCFSELKIHAKYRMRHCVMQHYKCAKGSIIISYITIIIIMVIDFLPALC